MKKVILLILIVLAVVLAVHFSPIGTPTSTPELQQRLDLLVEQLEQQRQTHHVPGMAIAVVKEDEVVLTHGFGLADVEESESEEHAQCDVPCCWAKEKVQRRNVPELEGEMEHPTQKTDRDRNDLINYKIMSNINFFKTPNTKHQPINN